MAASAGAWAWLVLKARHNILEAMDPKISLEQMLAAIPQQRRCELDQKVSDAHLAEIARELTNWKSVCTNLRISEAEEKAIEEENKEVDVRRYLQRAFVLY